ncbi:MAG: signal peptidase I [Eubacterium sp.]|nr:signal peptidase I [Eubacterium sp.]
MKVFKLICKIVSTLIICCMLAVGAAFVIPTFMGYTGYAVVSGSMVPTIPVGAIVYDEEVSPEDLTENDIVTYTLVSGDLVTHRITSIDDGAQTVTTKGDANSTEDSSPVPFTSIVGKTKYIVPCLGYISIYGKTKLGLAALCGIIAILILLLYLPEALSPSDESKDTEKTAKTEKAG